MGSSRPRDDTSINSQIRDHILGYRTQRIRKSIIGRRQRGLGLIRYRNGCLAALLAEVEAEGGKAALVARRHGMLLSNWPRGMDGGGFCGESGRRRTSFPLASL